MTTSLRASKYAPKTHAESLVASHARKLKDNKAKAARLFTRLRWKAESLASSHLRAVDILHAEANKSGLLNGQGDVRYPFFLGASSVRRPHPCSPLEQLEEAKFKKKAAGSMFKIDFFEFYTLLERYIILCLEIMGVTIPASAAPVNVNALRFITNPDYARSRPEATHAFHQNLLDAIDDEYCPLHVSFGNQDVRIQLGLAKDYRNAWKDADETLTTHSAISEGINSRRNVKLEELDLVRMLHTLLAGCEHALGLVSGQAESNTDQGYNQQDPSYAYDSMNAEVPLEYMDDAMDLD